MKINIFCRKISWGENENEIRKNDWKSRFLTANVLVIKETMVVVVILILYLGLPSFEESNGQSFDKSSQ